MLVTIAIVVGLLLAALLGYAATRPDTFRVQRTGTMQAPPSRIFDLIDDYHNWASWSPYEKLDAAMKKTFSGATRGKGAVYTWAVYGPQPYMDKMMGKDFAAGLASMKAIAESQTVVSNSK